VVSFLTCAQNLKSFRCGLVGFDVVCGIRKFRSSLSLSPGVNWCFDIILSDSKV